MKGLTVSEREQSRVLVLNQVLEGGCSVREAAELMALSERQAWRLVAGYRERGLAAVVHGNRGRQPKHALSEETVERVRALAASRYSGLNYCHLADRLEEQEALVLSPSSVRRILQAAGIKSPRRRRAPKHRSRRQRYPQEGMLLQVDGSQHDWLEGRGPVLTLIGGIDDATGSVPGGLFRRAGGHPGLLPDVQAGH